MKTVGRAFGALGRTVSRLVRWSFATVEDDPITNVTPMPGPAHGPIAAIDVRPEARRRSAS